MGEAMFDGGATGGQDPVGLLLARGELAGAGGLVGGDDDLVIGVLGFVDAEEAEVGERAEAGRLQMLDDLVAAGGGGVMGPSRTAEIQISLPFSSVRARKCRPWRWCFPE